MTETIEKVRATIATTFEIPIESVTEESSGLTVEKWDSIGHINLVMALEQQFGVSFTMEEIMQVKDVATICKVIGEKSK
jgi:acyl carrier protein